MSVVDEKVRVLPEHVVRPEIKSTDEVLEVTPEAHAELESRFTEAACIWRILNGDFTPEDVGMLCEAAFRRGYAQGLTHDEVLVP